jgi:hypothetical protein
VTATPAQGGTLAKLENDRRSRALRTKRLLTDTGPAIGTEVDFFRADFYNSATMRRFERGGRHQRQGRNRWKLRPRGRRIRFSV